MYSERPAHYAIAPNQLTETQILEQLGYLHETLALIDTSLEAPDFNEGDRIEVERSREFFAARHEAIAKLAGHSLRAAQYAA